jgi:hypothetical protein
MVRYARFGWLPGYTDAVKYFVRAGTVCVLLFVLGLVAWAAGPTPVGKWKGTPEFKFKNPPTPQQKSFLEQIGKTVLTLTFLKNHTFTASGSGTASQTGSGTWSQSGNKVTMKPKAGQPGQDQVAVLSTNGKTLTITLPENPQVSGKIVFKR